MSLLTHSNKTEKSVKFSLLVSVSDVLINLAASIVTGSTVLLSQSLQGVSDVISTALVYFGYKHSKKKADNKHPLGYGRELFFWVLLASVITAASTGLYSIIQGVEQVNNSQPLEATYVAIIVLLVGIMTNSYSVRSSLNSIIHRQSIFSYIRDLLKSSFVEIKLSILIDSLGTISGLVGLVSITLYILTDNAALDGYGAIIIGSITIIGAATLIRDLYGLIIGESADMQTINSIKEKLLEVQDVEEVNSVKAIVIGSGLLLVIVDVRFHNDLSPLQITHRSATIRNIIKQRVPGVKHVVVESR